MSWDLPIDGLPSPASSPGKKFLQYSNTLASSSLCEPETTAPEPHANNYAYMGIQPQINKPADFLYVNTTNPRQTSIERGQIAVNTPAVPYITASIIDDAELDEPAAWQKRAEHIETHQASYPDDDTSIALSKPMKPKPVKPNYACPPVGGALPKIPTDAEIAMMVEEDAKRKALPKKRSDSANLSKAIQKKAQLAPKSGVPRDIIIGKLKDIIAATPADVPTYSMDDRALAKLVEQTLKEFNDSLYKL